MKLPLPIAIISVFFFLLACNSQHKDYFSKKNVRHSQKLIGLDYSKKALDTLYPYLIRNRKGYDTLRQFKLDYLTTPALSFDPRPKGFAMPRWNWEESEFLRVLEVEVPENKEEMAFYSISQLANLLRRQEITSLELTQLYLDRLKKHDQTLYCVINLTEELAIQQAKRADSLIEEGIFLSPLHGIPYGIKDLFSVEGYPTTWGSEPYKDQYFDHTATVATKLEEAGAVLVAKLTSGALARGDVWFGGQTKNPWDTQQGASGSSAGSGSATSAGLVAFAIGTETLGSITSPSTRNGITGLRPTYGQVSRYGVMSLSWSMDKVGPMCRSAEDCAIVFQVIKGKDSLDPSTVDAPFQFEHETDLSALKVGYLQDLVEKDTSESGKNMKAAIEVIQEQGIELIPLKLPEAYPFAAFDIILRSEAGAFFDELVLTDAVDDMVQQNQRSRANSLRQSRFIPAVEYLQANRYRSELIEAMNELMKDIDVLITPTFGGRQLMITNLTGHPVVCLPTGLDSKNHPTSISFLGNLYDEETILEFGYHFQEWTDFDERHPEDYYPK